MGGQARLKGWVGGGGGGEGGGGRGAGISNSSTHVARRWRGLTKCMAKQGNVSDLFRKKSTPLPKIKLVNK